MARIKRNSSVLNQFGSPSLNSNTLANRPTFGQVGRLFVDTTNNIIQRDTGSSWVNVGVTPGSIGTLQQVTELGAITSIPTTFGTTNNALNTLTIKGAFNQNVYNGTSDDIAGDTFYQYNTQFNQLLTGTNLFNAQFLNEKFVTYGGDISFENGSVNCINYSILYLAGSGNITGNQELGNTKLGLNVNGYGGVLSLQNIKTLEILRPYGQSSPNVDNIYGIYIAKQSVSNININGTGYSIYQEDVDDINLFKGNTVIGEIYTQAYKLNVGGTFYLYKTIIEATDPIILECEISFNKCKWKVQADNGNFEAGMISTPENGDGTAVSSMYAFNTLDDFIARFTTRIYKENPIIAHYSFENMPVANDNDQALLIGLEVGDIYRKGNGALFQVI
jgi:hypothetical protein